MDTLRAAYQDLAGVSSSSEQLVSLATEMLTELACCTRATRSMQKIDIGEFESVPLEILRRDAKARALAGRGEDADLDVNHRVHMNVALPGWVRDAIRRAAMREGVGAEGNIAHDGNQT